MCIRDRLYNEDFSDLKFVYEITNIVYDSNIVATETNQDEDVPVNVVVVDKKNIPEDIYNGQFSPRVQFCLLYTSPWKARDRCLLMRSSRWSAGAAAPFSRWVSKSCPMRKFL